jgi:hypothetical protein
MIGRIFIGYDPKEETAYRVAEYSVRKHSSIPLVVTPLFLDRIRTAQLLWRRFEKRDGIAWDVLSKAPMSTEFALSRFLVPLLAHSGWSLFIDPDVLVTSDVAELFKLANPKYGVMCVQHAPFDDRSVKMDGQIQTHYDRKNWSSVALYNSDHPGNLRLSLGILNNTPGRQLHGFRWLDDDAIGALPAAWNHLVGLAPRPLFGVPALIHYTLGLPNVPGYEDCDYADLWRAALAEI